MTKEVTAQPAEGIVAVGSPGGGKGRTALGGVLALVALYVFISSVSMIGTGLKTMAKDPAGERVLTDLFATIGTPITGLCVGLLVTSLVQSSSFTTSMTVGLVAVGDISLPMAIPIIMGANIGTSVTNLLVSMAHVRRRKEFRRSFSGAVVHDFFNVLSVLTLLPLEMAFGILSRATLWISAELGGTALFASDPTKKMGVLKAFFGQPGRWADVFCREVLGLSSITAGWVVAAAALVLLFVALWALVRELRTLMQDRLSGLFSRTLFRNAPVAFVVGILMTAAVQSSSVTTSLIVPLVGANILKLRQIYPYTLGANIGTTLTAMLAALGTGSAAALACAFGHLLFNCMGTAIYWPLQFIPISLAKGFARLASRRRVIAVGFLVFVFFLLPITVIGLYRWLGL